jgi:hypothetical protein
MQCKRPGLAFHQGRLSGTCSPDKIPMAPMKMLTEYLERAVEFEKLAASEQSGTFKAELLKQAAAYRKLAAKRAEEYGLPAPKPPEVSN